MKSAQPHACAPGYGKPPAHAASSKHGESSKPTVIGGVVPAEAIAVKKNKTRSGREIRKRLDIKYSPSRWKANLLATGNFSPEFSDSFPTASHYTPRRRIPAPGAPTIRDFGNVFPIRHQLVTFVTSQPRFPTTSYLALRYR